jgi:hypothetical protein
MIKPLLKNEMVSSIEWGKNTPMPNPILSLMFQEIKVDPRIFPRSLLNDVEISGTSALF